MARWRVERKTPTGYHERAWRVFMVPTGYKSWIYIGRFESWQDAYDYAYAYSLRNV